MNGTERGREGARECENRWVMLFALAMVNCSVKNTNEKPLELNYAFVEPHLISVFILFFPHPMGHFKIGAFWEKIYHWRKKRDSVLSESILHHKLISILPNKYLNKNGPWGLFGEDSMRVYSGGFVDVWWISSEKNGTHVYVINLWSTAKADLWKIHGKIIIQIFWLWIQWVAKINLRSCGMNLW